MEGLALPHVAPLYSGAIKGYQLGSWLSIKGHQLASWLSIKGHHRPKVERIEFRSEAKRDIFHYEQSYFHR